MSTNRSQVKNFTCIGNIKGKNIKNNNCVNVYKNKNSKNVLFKEEK